MASYSWINRQNEVALLVLGYKNASHQANNINQEFITVFIINTFKKNADQGSVGWDIDEIKLLNLNIKSILFFDVIIHG